MNIYLFVAVLLVIAVLIAVVLVKTESKRQTPKEPAAVKQQVSTKSATHTA